MFPLLDSNTFNLRCIRALNSLFKQKIDESSLKVEKEFYVPRCLDHYSNK